MSINKSLYFLLRENYFHPLKYYLRLLYRPSAAEFEAEVNTMVAAIKYAYGVQHTILNESETCNPNRKKSM
jgi:hypothetical protein